MAEYVEKENVKEELLLWARCINKPKYLVTEDAMYVIDSMEPADVEPVIHCKDCDCYYFADNRVPEEQEWVCALLGRHMNPSDYCSRAYKIGGDAK